MIRAFLCAALAASVASIVAGCGSSSSSSSAAAADTTPYNVGGSVSTPLTTTGLVLRNNGGNDLTVNSGSTTFTFTTKVANGSAYAVTVYTQPYGQFCTVHNGSGTVAGAAVTSVAVSCGAWSSKPSLNAQRDGHGVAAIGTTLYAVGGENGATLLTTTSLEAFDTASATSWTTMAPMTTARYLLTAQAVSGKLYAIGGYNAGTLTTVEAYDPTGNSWSPKTAMPTSRYMLGSGVINGLIYVAGGYSTTSGAATAVLEAYDPVGNSWNSTALASMPTARYGVTAAVANGILYVIGGTVNGSTMLNTVEAYNPTSDSWSTKASRYYAAQTAGSFVINGIIYVFGGFTTNTINTAEAYDPGTNTWYFILDMTLGRSLANGVAVGGVGYAPGGRSGTSHAEVEAYTP